ncbi:Outer membrane protein [Helicobacter bizzozeronii]|uniref:copper resistance outer membrane protein CrdB n=1 Tax=Helicobacter bizzozeronii TaxID=56877 RepID=UPI00244D8B47|nr:copper resistance outer membrane protein CrdB [Helicobacter bizzozeronii]GMB92688.1 Outer membrane protein [Helicobacter bizzozeronii]
MRALFLHLLFVALQGVALATPLNLQVVYKKYLVKNAKIASLQAQIDSLQAQAQAVSRWDNPILYVGYNNADVNNFFILDSSFMQSISVGLSQKFDVNGKRHTQKQVVQIERQKKILELEQLKQQIAINILSNAINVYKNTQKLALLKDALDNIENLLYRAKHSSNPDQIAIAKLEVIKAQWEIKQNDLQDSLADNKISISELTFNQSDLLSLAPSLIAFKPEVELKEIMETNRTIKIASLQNSQALKNITLAKKSFLEDINVTANYLFRSKIFDMFTIGVAIPLPIYGKQNNTLQQRREEHLVALNSLENIKNSVQHNARKLIKKLTQLQKNLANIEQILQASEHIVQIYKDNLPSSQGDYNSYYNAFNDTINTKLLQLETKSALATNYLALENLKGLQ